MDFCCHYPLLMTITVDTADDFKYSVNQSHTPITCHISNNVHNYSVESFTSTSLGHTSVSCFQISIK